MCMHKTYKCDLYCQCRLRQQIMWLLDALVAPARPLAMSQVHYYDIIRNIRISYSHDIYVCVCLCI